MVEESPVIIVGAGIAGLAAACKLGGSGLSVVMLEARDRIGGRILTLREPAFASAIELGAEFIHGMPPEMAAATEVSVRDYRSRWR